MFGVGRAFTVGVTFMAIDRLSGGLRHISREMGIVQQRTEATERRLRQFAAMGMTGAAITGIGAVFAKHIEHGVDQAGEFLTKMIVIKDTVGATTKEMERLQKTLRLSVGTTIFDMQQGSTIAQSMATSGLNMEQINQLLPLFLRYAEVQNLGKGASPETAIQQLIGVAHGTGHYDAKGLSEVAEELNRATFMQPGSSTEYFDTLKYVMGRTKGVLEWKEQFQLAALANRFGLSGSIGGTQSVNMIQGTISGMRGGLKSMQQRQVLGLQALGLDKGLFDAKGKWMGLPNFLEKLSAAYKKIPSDKDRLKFFAMAFGQQGMGLATALSKGGLEQLDMLLSQMKQMKTIEQFQHDLNQGILGQSKQLSSNLNILKLDVFVEMSKTLTPLFKHLNAVVSRFMAWLDTEPKMKKLVANLTLMATAAALIVGPAMAFVGAIGWLATSGLVSAGILTIIGSFVTLGAWIGVIAAGVAILYTAWKTNWHGIRTYTEGVFKDFEQYYLNDTNYAGKLWAKHQKWIDSFGTHFRSEWDRNNKHFIKTANNLEITFTALCNTMTGAWSAVQNTIKGTFDLIDSQLQHLIDIGILPGKTTRQQAVAQGYAVRPDSGPIPASGNKPWYPNTTLEPNRAPSWAQWFNNWWNGAGHNATGTDFWRGGPTWVGERGPEIVNLPRGSQVIPNHALGGGGNVTIEQINIHQQPNQDVHELVRILKREIGDAVKNAANASPIHVAPSWR